MSGELFFYLIIGFFVVEFLFETIVDLLDFKTINGNIPSLLSDLYNKEEYEKSMLYNKEKGKFHFFSSFTMFIPTFLFLYLGWAGDIHNYVAKQVNDPILQGLTFFGILYIFSDVLGIPFSLYNIFVIEQKHGFNKMSVSTYITDKIKGYLIAVIVGGGILYLLLWIIQYLNADFWIYFWVIISVFMVFINMFYTSLIVPIFNKLTPLEDGELKSAINTYASKVGFPLNNIYVINGSKRSKKANAYFSGLGPKKKVVLFDTLIENHTNEELIAILAHEVGHFKKKHIISGMVLSILQTGLILFLLSLFIFSKELSMAMGANENVVHINLIAFFLILSPFSKIIGIVMNVFSRKNEYEADAYASETYSKEAMVSALKKLSKDHLSNLSPHPLNVFMNYSHPTLLQRISAIGNLKTGPSTTS